MVDTFEELQDTAMIIHLLGGLGARVDSGKQFVEIAKEMGIPVFMQASDIYDEQALKLFLSTCRWMHRL